MVRRVTLGAIVLALLPASASAETFTAACAGTTGDAASLVSAINAANTNGAAADAVALGPGCVYTLTSAENYWYGPNGLPAIASDITIQGNGATITRSDVASNFRFFFVGADPVSTGYATPGAGSLTLRELTLTGGLAKGGDSNGGGGGAGMGGAIFSQGAVVIERSTLAANRAHGGSAGVFSAGGGGGGIGTDAAGVTGGGFGPSADFGTGSFPSIPGGAGGAGDTSGATGSGGAGGGGTGFHIVDSGNAASGPDPGPGGGAQTGLGGYGAGSSQAPGALGGDGSGGGGGRGRCGCGGFPDGDGGAGGAGGAFAAGGARGGAGTGAGDSDGIGGGGGGGGGGGVGGGGGAGGTGGPEGGGSFPGEGGHGGAGGFGAGGGEGGLDGESTARNPGGSGGFGGGGGRPRPVVGNGDGGFGGGTASGDTAAGGAGMGGAIFNMQGDLTIRASTFAGNSAAGGLPAVPDPGKGLGGAIFNLSASLEAVGVTFAENTATHDGSSVYNLVYDAKTVRAAEATLRDTIVADASSQIDLVSYKPSMTLDLQPNLGSASALVGDFDLVRTYVARDAGTVTGAPLTADPLLGPLGDNGGPTRTMAPSEGSPVVDAGSAFGLVADQRGLSRPFDLTVIPNAGDGSDIGAVEMPLVRPGQPGGGGGPGSTTPAFGANTLVTLTLAAKRIPARGPLKIRVANANGFEIAGRLSGQTVNRISAALKRRTKLRAKQFRVAANTRATVRLALPKPIRRVLKRTGRVRLRLTANVKDPAGNTRTVKKRVTPRVKRKRRR